MLALAIVIAVLILLAFLRFGASAEYGADGFLVAARVGPFSFTVFPVKEEAPEKAEKKALKRARKKTKVREKAKEKPARKMAPGALTHFLDMIPPVMKTLGRVKRRLLIKKLTIHYTAGGDDPVTTAMAYGAANAVFGAIVPALENNFRIRKRDLRAFADFQSVEQKIYVSAAFSIAVWEAVYIAAAMLPVIRSVLKIWTVTKDRKEDK